MEEHIFIKLKENLYDIKAIYSNSDINKNKLEPELGEIRFARKQIEKKANRRDKRLLLYCIDTLFSLIEENDRKKVYAFADTICDIPDIYLGYRNLYSFSDKIKGFQKLYGEEYFKGIYKVYPRFTKKAPRNFLYYFNPASDEEFKKEHPIGYFFLVLLGIFALVAPMILLAVISGFRKYDSYLLIISLIGAFIMGVGLFNIVAAIIHQYLGHLVTIICLLGGGIILSVPLLILEFSHPIVIFYGELFTHSVTQTFMLLITLIAYLLFRFSVADYISDKHSISNDRFDGYLKGFKGWLWYQTLRRDYSLGLIYPLNLVYTLSFMAALFFSILTTFEKAFSLPLCFTIIICYLSAIIMAIFSIIQRNLKKYGSAIIIFAKKKGNSPDSIVFDLFGLSVIVALSYTVFASTAKLYGIDLPAFTELMEMIFFK